VLDKLQIPCALLHITSHHINTTSYTSVTWTKSYRRHFEIIFP